MKKKDLERHIRVKCDSSWPFFPCRVGTESPIEAFPGMGNGMNKAQNLDKSYSIKIRLMMHSHLLREITEENEEYTLSIELRTSITVHFRK